MRSCTRIDRHFRAARLIPLVLVLASGACASAGSPALLGPPRAQPPALVGRWRPLDPAGIPAADRVLVLDASARAWEEARGERTAPRSWWWVYAANDESPARLCVGWRPGRRAADCRSFALDSAGGDAAQRLTWGDRRYAREVAAAEVAADTPGE